MKMDWVAASDYHPLPIKAHPQSFLGHDTFSDPAAVVAAMRPATAGLPPQKQITGGEPRLPAQRLRVGHGGLPLRDHNLARPGTADQIDSAGAHFRSSVGFARWLEMFPVDRRQPPPLKPLLETRIEGVGKPRAALVARGSAQCAHAVDADDGFHVACSRVRKACYYPAHETLLEELQFRRPSRFPLIVLARVTSDALVGEADRRLPPTRELTLSRVDHPVPLMPVLHLALPMFANLRVLTIKTSEGSSDFVKFPPDGQEWATIENCMKKLVLFRFDTTLMEWSGKEFVPRLTRTVGPPIRQWHEDLSSAAPGACSKLGHPCAASAQVHRDERRHRQPRQKLPRCRRARSPIPKQAHRCRPRRAPPPPPIKALGATRASPGPPSSLSSPPAAPSSSHLTSLRTNGPPSPASNPSGGALLSCRPYSSTIVETSIPRTPPSTSSQLVSHLCGISFRCQRIKAGEPMAPIGSAPGPTRSMGRKGIHSIVKGVSTLQLAGTSRTSFPGPGDVDAPVVGSLCPMER
ncbi:hypothetical protein BDK51DRAFT_51996 [Blyttiomyces helicus]|uniref:Uncharacterized protein n=1 Tax=Blyttiomyces helicus TaxID=388810 RepID=A0A4P9WB63_9FUNG|nr:hypothetical protein BDK51DRAFT_51996 [Blyttiomyces helicus]|eukprot:RKO88825.1 hypothetical protein BDK51DRAFT_51996 [Blyttiomyces helicus]